MRRSPGETRPEDIGTRNNLLCVLYRGRRQFRVRSDVRVRLTLGLEAPSTLRPCPGTPRPVAFRRRRPFSWFQVSAATRAMTTDTDDAHQRGPAGGRFTIGREGRAAAE